MQDRVERLTAENALLCQRLRSIRSRRPYPLTHRLKILWHIEYFRIPRRRVTRHLLVARATLYRWLHALQEGTGACGQHDRESPKKTPRELAALIWEVFSANPQWGQRRIAMTLWTLGIFVAASTVRNILLAGRPRKAPAGDAKAQEAASKARRITARHPNHVWSLDRTRVYRWGIWPTWVLVAVDHFSRKVTLAECLKRAKAQSVRDALLSAFAKYAPPKYLISDQGQWAHGTALLCPA